MTQQPILFIWIPKNAGTTCYEIFKQQFGMKLHLDVHAAHSHYKYFDNQGSITFGHADVKAIIKEKIITIDYFSQCMPFAVVRNPYTRFVSLYNDFIRSKRFDGTFFEFARDVKKARDLPFTSPCTKIGMYNVDGYSQTACQTDWLLPITVTIKFEELKKGLKTLFGYDGELPHLNRETFDDHMRCYDDEALEIVNDLYYQDFVLLNYEMI